jgi:hypothetical protein
MTRDHCVKCGFVANSYNGRIYERALPLELFMGKTKRDPASGCLLWTASTNDKGYPIFHASDAQGCRFTMGAHRWIFREKFGYLPEVVMHRCDTPLCVDWERCLIPGTHADNMTDMIRKGRDRHDRSGFRLTPSQVREIRSRREHGETCKALAREFGISVNGVRDCANGRTYANIS